MRRSNRALVGWSVGWLRDQSVNRSVSQLVDGRSVSRSVVGHSGKAGETIPFALVLIKHLS